MSLRLQDVVLLVLAAGAVAASVKIIAPKAAQGRLRQAAWSTALLLIAISALSTVWYPLGVRNEQWLALGIPLAAAAVLAVNPRLARRVVPVALILLGLAGFVLARDLPDTVDTYGLVAIQGWFPLTWATDLVLAQAYGFLLLGGWLAWRSPDPVLSLARLALAGSPDRRAPLAVLRRLVLLPVVIASAALIVPGVWMGGSVDVLWTAVMIGGTVAVIGRRPVLAERLGAIGLAGLGLAGLVLAWTWAGGASAFPRTNSGGVLYGLVAVYDQHLAFLAAAEALVLLGAGGWLLPQVYPQLRRGLGLIPDIELTRRVARLTESRAVAVDTASAELRRLERDLHDGAQARLVALGMSLRAAERLIPTSPDAAVALVAEAREASARALTELRELVRGVHPPVLADRGLTDAVRALALDSPLQVSADIDLPGRAPAGRDRVLLCDRRDPDQRSQAFRRAGSAHRHLLHRWRHAHRGDGLRSRRGRSGSWHWPRRRGKAAGYL